MKTTDEKEWEQARKPGNLKPQKTDPTRPSGQDNNKDSEDKDETTVVLDINKESFTERPHGRTTEPLGPGHEPGTV